MTPKNEVEHGVCSYCGADRSGPSAEAHEPNCLYAEPEPQGSDNSAGPRVPPSAEQVCPMCCKPIFTTGPSAELKERARVWHRENRVKFLTGEEVLPYGRSKETIEYLDEAAMLAAFASSIQEEAETWKRILANRDETLVEMRQDLIVAKTQRDEFKQQLAEARAQGMREAATCPECGSTELTLYYRNGECFIHCSDDQKHLCWVVETAQDFRRFFESEPRAGRDLEGK